MNIKTSRLMLFLILIFLGPQAHVYAAATVINPPADSKLYFGGKITSSGNFLFVTSGEAKYAQTIVHTYQNIDNQWQYTGSLKALDRWGYTYGVYDLSIDGNRAVLAYSDRFDIYEFNNGQWIRTQVIWNNWKEPNEGTNQSIKIKGNLIVVGGFSDITNGSARIYRKLIPGWRLESKISDTNIDVLFGLSVDISGPWVFVSASQANPDGIFHAGRVYIYRKQFGSWRNT